MKLHLCAGDVLGTLPIDSVTIQVVKWDPTTDPQHDEIRKHAGTRPYEILDGYKHIGPLKDGSTIPIFTNVFNEGTMCNFRCVIFIVDDCELQFSEVVFNAIESAIDLHLSKLAFVLQYPQMRKLHRNTIPGTVQDFMDGIEKVRKTYPEQSEDFELSLVFQFAPRMFEAFEDYLHRCPRDELHIVQITAEI